MKKTAILFALAAFTACNNATNNDTPKTAKADTAAAATAKPTSTPPPMDSATMNKRAAQYMTPGEGQKLLASMDGKWTTESSFWMEENAPAQKSTGTCENKMILGGRYQQSTHKGDMSGMPFEGIGITGFDNIRKVFVNSWVDNMGTGIMYLEGPVRLSHQNHHHQRRLGRPHQRKNGDEGNTENN